MDIKVYSTPACPYCAMAKEHFTSKNISFENLDVSVNSVALEEMTKVSGQMGVPVISINGQIIVGFDKAKIESLLSE